MKRNVDTREQMLIDTLTKELPLLRARLNISQEDLAKKGRNFKTNIKFD